MGERAEFFAALGEDQSGKWDDYPDLLAMPWLEDTDWRPWGTWDDIRAVPEPWRDRLLVGLLRFYQPEELHELPSDLRSAAEAAAPRIAAAQLLANPSVPLKLAKQLANGYAARYRSRRGSMVVDVVASAARNYDRVEGWIVPAFEALDGGSDLEALARTAPAALRGLGLRPTEPETMIAVARGMLRYGENHDLPGDEATCAAWAEYGEQWRRTPKLDPYVGVKGINTALYAYLRMRSGADAIKPDVWVARLLGRHGAVIRNPGDPLEVLECAEQVARAAGIDRLVLDQLLWRGEWKIAPAALRLLAATDAWREHGPKGASPTAIYGKRGGMGHLYGIAFATRADLQEALAANHGGGVAMEVIEALVTCCGPRLEG